MHSATPEFLPFSICLVDDVSAKALNHKSEDLDLKKKKIVLLLHAVRESTNHEELRCCQ